MRRPPFRLFAGLLSLALLAPGAFAQSSATNPPVRFLVREVEDARQWDRRDWALRLALGQQMLGVELRSDLQQGHAALLADGQMADESVLMGLMQRAISRGLQLFSAAAGNVIRVETHPSGLPAAEPGATTIYVLGARWCQWCRPTAGELARYVQAARRSGARVNLVYLDVDVSASPSSMARDPVVRSLAAAGAMPTPAFLPTVAVFANGALLTRAGSDAYLNGLVAYVPLRRR